MVHTAQLIRILSKEDIRYIENKFGSSIQLLRESIPQHQNGITAKFYYFPVLREWIMYINIDFIKLLETSKIDESHYPVIEREIFNFIHFVFDEYKEFQLSRIDYRFDCSINEAERKEILKILKKTYNKYRFKKKYDLYTSSIYFNCKSIQCIVYDKEAERIYKKARIEEYEKDVLRFEVRLKNRHLLYMQAKYNIERDLKNYIKQEVYKKYIISHLMQFIPPGNFMKIYEADKQISNSNLKEKEKKLLREFLVDISKSSLSHIPEIEIDKDKKSKYYKGANKEEKYSKYKIKKALELLADLNISPFLIPKNDKCPNTIKNPLNDIYYNALN